MTIVVSDALLRGYEGHPGVAHLLKQFCFEHLATDLREISEKCAEQALDMALNLPDNPEKIAGLRKLLEAKDCFVRARLS